LASAARSVIQGSAAQRARAGNSRTVERRALRMASCAWAAGSATRMPSLADAVPNYCDCCSIFADANQAGEQNSAELAARLAARGIYAEIVPSAGAAP